MASQRILITGAQGFIGSRLAPFLSERGHTVEAASFDLLDFQGMEKVLKSTSWDSVVHLAAISHVPTCENDPAQAYKVNLGGTALLLQALQRHSPKTRLLFTSTAQVYAAPHGDELQAGVIFDEDRRIAPQNTYAQTKWKSELLIRDCAQREGLKATVLRLFNHSHKSQSPDFFLPHLYQAIQKAPTDRESEVPVGNLDVARDIGSIRDLLGAFGAVIDRAPLAGESELFNICSGQAKKLSALAHGLATRLGKRVRFVTDPSRVRQGEPISISGSHRRLSEETGWTPHCQDEASLLDQFLAD